MVIGFDGSRVFIENRTGTENYSYQLLKSLSKIDSEQSSRASRTKNQYIVFIRKGAKGIEGFPKNFQFKQINWLRLWTQGGLAKETFNQNLDVLFVPAHTLPLIRKPGLKTVVTVHDLGSEYLPSSHQVKQRLYLSLMQKYQLNTATRLIAVSEATKNDLVKRIGINPQKITVTYEGYDKSLFKPSKNDPLTNSLRQYFLEKGNYFFFVGTVQPRKNLDRVIRAFAKVRTDKLVIAGSKGWLSDEIYSLPKKLGIENRIKFLGYVPEKSLPALYTNALGLIFPSLFEGFGLTILEAQACGCPVITSNLSSMPEIAGEGAILVDPYNEDDIVRAMIKVQDKSVRKQLIKDGFENIKKFSWEKCAKETLKVLESI